MLPMQKSKKDYAEYLHSKGIAFERACEMAGYDPMQEYRESAVAFGVAVVTVLIVVCLLFFIPQVMM